MKTKFSALILLLSITSFKTLSAQPLLSGNLLFLKHEKVINIEFVYDSMGVGSKTEAEYILEKVNEQNESLPGKGDKWLVEWNDNKAFNYPNAFIVNFNKKMKKSGIVAEKHSSAAKYTMVVKTHHFESGFSGIGLITMASEVNLEILFYESNIRSQEVAKLSLGSVSGASGAPATAYGVAGTNTAK
jgi:hypothetical protein